MKRVPEVIDCWFDSGAMPFAQHHYPFENKEIFEQQFPAKFISEGVDQTRGWFYSLMAESTLLFNKEEPYQFNKFVQMFIYLLPLKIILSEGPFALQFGSHMTTLLLVPIFCTFSRPGKKAEQLASCL